MDLYRERVKLQTEFNLLTTEMAEDLDLKSRQKYYEREERASKLLSHQLRQSEAAGFISEIETTEGEITTDLGAINDQFKTFYNALYSSEGGDKIKIDQFFETIEMPTLNADDKQELDKAISRTEIEQAI